MADLGVVEQDALHDARLQLALFGGQLLPAGRMLELRDQQHAGALELDDLIPVAGTGGRQHVGAGLFNRFVVAEELGVHHGIHCRCFGRGVVQAQDARG